MSVSTTIYRNPLSIRTPLVWHARLRMRIARLFSPNMILGLRSVAGPLIGATKPAGKLIFRSQPSHLHIPASNRLRIISANLWHDYPRFRALQARMSAFARMAEENEADILLLQEVTRTRKIKMDEYLSRRLGMAYLYSRANGHRQGIGFEEGIAIFSKYPMSNPVLRQLSSQANPFSRRLALSAEICAPWGRLQTFTVHLGLGKKENNRQIDHLQRWVAGVAGGKAAIVGGDFNAPENRYAITETQKYWLDTFREITPKGDAVTHELRFPWGGLLARHRLDYIFLRQVHPQWKVIETRHIRPSAMPHSDHLAVFTCLEYLS